jgi:hypothetical protein
LNEARLAAGDKVRRGSVASARARFVEVGACLRGRARVRARFARACTSGRRRASAGPGERKSAEGCQPEASHGFRLQRHARCCSS